MFEEFGISIEQLAVLSNSFKTYVKRVFQTLCQYLNISIPHRAMLLHFCCVHFDNTSYIATLVWKSMSAGRTSSSSPSSSSTGLHSRTALKLLFVAGNACQGGVRNQHDNVAQQASAAATTSCAARPATTGGLAADRGGESSSSKRSRGAIRCPCPVAGGAAPVHAQLAGALPSPCRREGFLMSFVVQLAF